MSFESVMPSNHHILCHPLLLLLSIFPSIRVFSNESVLHNRWPKNWSFIFSVSPTNEYWGLISFRMDWLDLLTVQGTLKSLLQQHSSKASILQHSAFFIVQLSHPYMTTGKTVALTRQTFVSHISRVTNGDLVSNDLWSSLWEKPFYYQSSSVQSLSRVRLFETPWTAAHQASLSINNSQSLPKPMYIESVMPFNHLILCHPLLLLPSIFSSIRVFSKGLSIMLLS